MHKYGERKTTRIMMATVSHVTSSSGLRKFQADGFLLDGVYLQVQGRLHWSQITTTHCVINQKSAGIIYFVAVA